LPPRAFLCVLRPALGDDAFQFRARLVLQRSKSRLGVLLDLPGQLLELFGDGGAYLRSVLRLFPAGPQFLLQRREMLGEGGVEFAARLRQRLLLRVGKLFANLVGHGFERAQPLLQSGDRVGLVGQVLLD